jgi:hypothetical protein
MDMYFDDTLPRGLRQYVRLVSEALGLTGESWYVQADDAISAYIALDRRLRGFPGRDVALLWDENHGWSAAVETHSGEDLLVVAYFGRDVLPRPASVAAWASELFDRPVAEPAVPPFLGSDSGSAARLATYARLPMPGQATLTDAGA